MESTKKKRTKSSKSKQNKKVKVASGDVSLDVKEFEFEVLDQKTLREGQLVLGCVSRVDKYHVILSLPGCFSALVEANNVSNEFSEIVRNNSDEVDQQPSLSSILQPGMLFPCKIIKIDHASSSKKLNIFASLKPDDVYASLKPASLYLKMALYVSICSVEDHGYAVNVGIDQVKAFLPKQNCLSESLQIGQIVPTSIQQLHTDKHSAIIQLAELNFDEEFPNVSKEITHLHSVLPGAKISADVIEMKDMLLRLRFNDFDACASILCHSSFKKLDVGSSVEGTVLCVNPVSHVIHLALHSLPTPKLFGSFFPLKIFELVKKPKFLLTLRKRYFYKLSRGILGFVNSQDMPSSEEKAPVVSNLTGIDKARVVKFHYMDKLLQLSAKQSIVDEQIVLPEDVQVGNVYNAKIQRHVEHGMFVKISIGCYGFVRKIFMSDMYITKPDVLYPVGNEVKCRVLSSDRYGKINLTTKKSLLNLDESLILSSYASACRGKSYKGVIVKKSSSFIIILFFNEVKGIVNEVEIPESSVFFEGQTVTCKVLWCNPAKEQLRLSLKVQSLNFPAKDLSNNKATVKIANFPKSEKKKSNADKDNCVNENRINFSDNFSVNTESCKLETALIIKVKGHQLNINLGMQKGRVHITNLGCNIEGVYPLKEFSANRKISVYVVGEYLKKNKNFLDISHQNWSTFKDCVLSTAPVSKTCTFCPGDSVMGFVKETYDVSARIWLSPTKCGILEFLHCTKNPKIARRLSRHLKVGLSLKVIIWEASSDGKKEHNILLTKFESQKPEVGSNILGLVQVTCLERGLFLKLPFGYHGDVCVTDLSDVYSPVSALLQKYLKLKFVLCHVLDVNHESKYCQLSLRKSRLFQKVSSPNLCPEINASTLKEGDNVVGLVKMASNSAISVVIGRNLEGTVQLHSCSLDECPDCLLSKKVLKKYSTGAVINVIIEKSVNLGSYSFTLKELKKVDSKKCNRLTVNEDVLWEDMNNL